MSDLTWVSFRAKATNDTSRILVSAKSQSCDANLNSVNQNECPSHMYCQGFVDEDDSNTMGSCVCDRFLAFRGPKCQTKTTATWTLLVLTIVVASCAIVALFSNLSLALELRAKGRLKANSIGRTLLLNTLHTVPILGLSTNLAIVILHDQEKVQNLLMAYFRIACVAGNVFFYIMTTLSVSLAWAIDVKNTRQASNGTDAVQFARTKKRQENRILGALYFVSLLALVLVSLSFAMGDVYNPTTGIVNVVYSIFISVTFHYAGKRVIRDLSVTQVSGCNTLFIIIGALITAACFSGFENRIQASSSKVQENITKIMKNIKTTTQTLTRFAIGIALSSIGMALTLPTRSAPLYPGQNSLPRFLQGQIFYFSVLMCAVGTNLHIVEYMRYGNDESRGPLRWLGSLLLCRRSIGRRSSDRSSSEANHLPRRVGPTNVSPLTPYSATYGSVYGQSQSNSLDPDGSDVNGSDVDDRQSLNEPSSTSTTNNNNNNNYEEPGGASANNSSAADFDDRNNRSFNSGQPTYTTHNSRQGGVSSVMNESELLRTSADSFVDSTLDGHNGDAWMIGPTQRQFNMNGDDPLNRCVVKVPVPLYPPGGGLFGAGLSAVPSTGAQPYVPIVLATLHTEMSTETVPTPADSPPHSPAAAAAAAPADAAAASPSDSASRCRVRGRAVMDVGNGVLVDLDAEEMDEGELQGLSAGSHAFVRCYGERHLRCTWHAFDFGFAGGHPLLANSDMVLMAGEVEVDGQGFVTRWLNKSGLYMPPRWVVGQSGLPFSTAWLYVTAHEVDSLLPDRKAKLLSEGSLALIDYGGPMSNPESPLPPQESNLRREDRNPSEEVVSANSGDGVVAGAESGDGGGSVGGGASSDIGDSAGVDTQAHTAGATGAAVAADGSGRKPTPLISPLPATPGSRDGGVVGAVAAAVAVVGACVVPVRSVHAEDTWIMKVDDEHVWQFAVPQSAYIAAREAVVAYRTLKTNVKRKLERRRARQSSRIVPLSSRRQRPRHPRNNNQQQRSSGNGDGGPIQWGLDDIVALDSDSGRGGRSTGGGGGNKHGGSYFQGNGAVVGGRSSPSGGYPAAGSAIVHHELLPFGGDDNDDDVYSRGGASARSGRSGKYAGGGGGGGGGGRLGELGGGDGGGGAAASQGDQPAGVLPPLKLRQMPQSSMPPPVNLPPLPRSGGGDSILDLTAPAAAGGGGGGGVSTRPAGFSFELSPRVSAVAHGGGGGGGCGVFANGVDNGSGGAFSTDTDDSSLGRSKLEELRRMKKEMAVTGQRETFEQGRLERKQLKSNLGFSKQLQLTSESGGGGERKL